MRSRPGRTLAQRSGAAAGAAGEAQGGTTTAAPPDPPGRSAAVRHVWVEGMLDDPGRHAGVLLEWRRAPAWEGLVVYAVDEGRSGVRCVQRWVAAAHLRPV